MNESEVGRELSESDLKALVGEAEWERLTDEDDAQIPTILIGREQAHENIFMAFQSRAEVEFLLAQLTSLLVHQQGKPAEYAISVRGRAMTSGDYYEQTPELNVNEERPDEAMLTPYD